MLLQRIGRLVSKEQLVDHLCEWGEEVSNNAIEVYVHRLRKKIEPSGVRISTVRGLGYCLEKVAPPRRPTRQRPSPRWPARRCAEPGRRRDGHAGPSPPSDRRAVVGRRQARDARYENPFAPPDETDAPEAPRPRSLFGEILDWMLAPLLLLWPMSIAVTYLVAKTIANGPFDRALETNAYVLARQIHPVNGVAELTLPEQTRDFLRATTSTACTSRCSAHAASWSRAKPTCRCRATRTARRQASSCSATTCCAATTCASRTTVALPQSGSPQPVLVQVGETLDKRNALANDIIKG